MKYETLLWEIKHKVVTTPAWGFRNTTYVKEDIYLNIKKNLQEVGKMFNTRSENVQQVNFKI